MTAIVLLILLGTTIYFVFYNQLLPKQNKPVVKQQVQEQPTVQNNVPAKADIKLTGTLETMERPAPDIAYDYKIKLDPPVYDEFSDGGGNQLHNFFILVPANPQIEYQLKSNVGKYVTLTGRIEWGLAETRHFLVNKVN
jgi:hypothetical protein